jgi:PKD repeat protein
MQRNTCFHKSNFRYLLFLSFLTGLFFLFSPLTNSFGRDVFFSWTANTDDPSVDGYRLYYKIGIPGLTLNDYNGTNADGGNSSSIVLPGQATTSYTLLNLLDSEKYSFVLTAYRGTEESASTSAIILEPTTPPTSILNAKMSTDTLNGENPLPVTFDATTSTGNIVNYEWMFGDGGTGTGSTTNHTFSSEGNFTVTLKVTDNLAATDQTTVSITVTNPSETSNPPSAVISSSSSVGPTPLLVNFDGSTSTDNDGNILSYEWDFGDGGSASGALANHTYSAVGIFNAKLTVTDDAGLTSSTTTPVLVSASTGGSNTPPTAVINTSTSRGYAPLAVSFNAGQSYDSDGNVESYSWRFGDGTVSTGVNVTHKFLQPAVYKVTLKVKDDKGADSLPATFTVTVLDKDQQDDSIPEMITQSLMAVYYLLLGPSSNEATVPEE